MTGLFGEHQTQRFQFFYQHDRHRWTEAPVQIDGQIDFRGATQLVEQADELTRTEEGWRISKRRGEAVFKRNPDEPVPLHTWGEREGRMASGK